MPRYGKLLLAFLWPLCIIALALPFRSSADDEEKIIAKRAEAVLKSRCYKCHGQNGEAAKNVFVLDRARLISSKTVLPADANSPLLRMIETGAMPLGGPELSAEEKGILRNWILSGAPDWNPAADESRASYGQEDPPKTFISESAIRLTILQDLERSRERARPFLRYFSLAHLYNAGIPQEELDSYRAALSKILNSLSWHRALAAPLPIDAQKTIFRVDLRDLDWTAANWNAILAAYPYGVRISGAEGITGLSGASVPYIRADWFAATASTAPLYNQLLGLPSTIQELEKRLGVDAGRNLDEEKNVVRAGIRNSGVSQNHRVVERHVSLHGAYWKSYDFSSSVGKLDIFRDPLALNPSGGEMIFNLPNGMQAYFITDAHGRSINEAPISIVSDRNYPEDPVVRNGRSCMGCHFEGIKSVKDDLRKVIEAQINGSFDRDKALALYAPQDALDQLIAEDGERFQSAVEKACGRIAANVQSEPINALARRFRAELSVEQAAAEAGLETEEFQAKIQRSPRLASLGFAQLLVSHGSIKREAWEKHFGDVVGELQIGQSTRGLNALQSNRSSTVFRTTAATAAASAAFEQKILIFSRTTFLKPALLEEALRKQQEFQALGLLIVDDWQKANISIELDRPLFTFTFTFRITDRQSGIVLENGKVTAFDGNEAAPKIAKEIVKRFKAKPSH